MKKAISSFLEIAKIGFFALLLVVGFRFFVFQPFLVKGASMEPNFHNWDYLIVDEVSYRFRAPERGEVIVFKFPHDPSQRYIKRIIGLPGETVEVKDGQIIISSHGSVAMVMEESEYLSSDTPGMVMIDLGENEYFVMGDNRQYSSDSRTWGSLPENLIIGRVFMRVFPLSAFAKIEHPVYNSL